MWFPRGKNTFQGEKRSNLSASRFLSKLIFSPAEVHPLKAAKMILKYLAHTFQQMGEGKVHSSQRLWIRSTKLFFLWPVTGCWIIYFWFMEPLLPFCDTCWTRDRKKSFLHPRFTCWVSRHLLYVPPLFFFFFLLCNGPICFYFETIDKKGNTQLQCFTWNKLSLKYQDNLFK